MEYLGLWRSVHRDSKWTAKVRDASSYIYHKMYRQPFCSPSCEVTLLDISDIFYSASRSPIFAWVSILDTHGKKQEDALIYSQGDMTPRWSYWHRWNVDPFCYGRVDLAPFQLLDSWWCQVTKLVTSFSSFFSGSISLQKSALSSGLSFDKSLVMKNSASGASWIRHPLSSISLKNTDSEVA